MKKRFNGLLRAISVWLVCLIVLGSSLSAGAVGQSAQGECAIYKKYDLPTRSTVTLASAVRPLFVTAVMTAMPVPQKVTYPSPSTVATR